MEVTCDACGSTLRRSPSHVKGHVFCNRDCRKAYHRPALTCVGCGSGFQRNPKNPSKLHCSWECFKEARHVTEVCIFCEAEFDTYVSEQRKRRERGHAPCCSRSCRNSYTSLLMGGDGTWTPGGRYNPKKLDWRWRKVRLSYLRLVGGQCEGCEGRSAEHVHHLHPRALGGPHYDFDNLMAVCVDCHDNMHAQLLAGRFACSFEGVEFDAALAGRSGR